MEPKPKDKQVKREARQLWDEARVAFAAGDFLRAAELDRKIIEVAPGTELAEKASAELELRKPDRKVLWAGVGGTILYLLAWWVSLSQ